ncbi:hypothetical protein MMEU_0721 [Mycobacterium marinum str. Europe]|nr:hypothetical protein MMEU_0721 [Mycobacterium marinum str. Europe]
MAAEIGDPWRFEANNSDLNFASQDLLPSLGELHIQSNVAP